MAVDTSRGDICSFSVDDLSLCASWKTRAYACDLAIFNAKFETIGQDFTSGYLKKCQIQLMYDSRLSKLTRIPFLTTKSKSISLSFEGHLLRTCGPCSRIIDVTALMESPLKT